MKFKNKTDQEHLYDFVEKNIDALQALKEKLGSYELVGLYLRDVIGVVSEFGK